MKKIPLLGLASLAIAACSDVPSPVGPTLAPSASPAAARGKAIEGRYIVVFREGTDVDRESARIASAMGGKVKHTYRAALRGMTIELPDAAAAALANVPSIASVEQDQIMTTTTTQTNATWGIDRIDQRALPLNASYVYEKTGAGVTAYIIDTGILLTHSEFAGGRATSGFDAVDGGSADDCNGHGTHVAGSVGGTTYGVAKSVSLVAVRVLGCDGSGANSGVIAGVDWVTANRQSPAVANMSLGGGLSSALDQAVARSITAGVTYGVAAGNGNFLGWPQNACNYSPANVPTAITVSATDNTDTKASWANYGTCVDIFAPGVGITSAWYDGATKSISGTSMATPHVVGAAALFLESSPGSTPAQVTSALTTNATTSVVRSGGSGSPNRLLYTGAVGGGSSTTPPNADFGYGCSGRHCTFNASAPATGTSYDWTFGDVGTGSGASTSYTFAPNRSYIVTLTATSSGGTSSTSQTVTCSKKTCS